MNGVNRFRRVDDGKIVINVNGSVVGWDEHIYYIQDVRNFTDKPIDLEIRRPFPGHIVFRSALRATHHDYQTVQFSKTIPAKRRMELRYEVVQHMGRNAKQANVKLVEVD